MDQNEIHPIMEAAVKLKYALCRAESEGMALYARGASKEADLNELVIQCLSLACGMLREEIHKRAAMRPVGFNGG